MKGQVDAVDVDVNGVDVDGGVDGVDGVDVDDVDVDGVEHKWRWWVNVLDYDN